MPELLTLLQAIRAAHKSSLSAEEAWHAIAPLVDAWEAAGAPGAVSALPGWTCPAIDKTKSLIRRIAWRAKQGRRDVRALEREALELLEEVRTDNRRLREACASRGGRP